ncbi:cubilin-like isoform X2 [Actinia tenebrosa]|nr:cubilin-like isoform X2 [Actinia tenebrosa]
MHNATSSGNLSSPKYPDWFPGNASCVWILTCPPGRLIKLYLNEVIFNNSSKKHLYLEIRDGVKASSPLILNITAEESKLKENNFAPIIYSSGQKLSLHLKKGLREANGSVRFRISYNSTKPGKSCSAKNTDDENNNILLTTPFLLTTGADLPSEVDCTWKITPSILGILMNITLNINKNLLCRTGNVSIFDGPYGPASKLKHSLCQESGGVSLFTSDVGLSFQLKSSNFSSFLQIQATEDDCIEETNSRYMTKNFHKGLQPLSRTRCQRKFSNPSGPLYIQFFYFQLPDGCENNSVQLFEFHKHSNKSTLRAKFCPPLEWWPDIIIYSGQALIKVQTEASSKINFKYGFFTYIHPSLRLPSIPYCSQYNSPEENANLILTARKDYISSPGMKYSYPPGMFCKWIILPYNITEKEQIRIKFDKFDFSKGYDKDCNQDHIQLDFGNGRVQRYCKATGDPRIIYSGDAKSLNVTFVSTPLYTANRGFLITYDVVLIVPAPPLRQFFSWTVIGVLIGAGCLLIACIAFGIYRWKRKKQHDKVMQRITNERDEQEDTLPDEVATATPTHQGPPPPYTGIGEESYLMQQPKEDQPYPWFSPGTTVMEHSPRERRPGPEMESEV